MRTHLGPSPVLQEGAYWRQTCSVLFDDPTDEDFDTRNLSCAHLSCNCARARVCSPVNYATVLGHIPVSERTLPTFMFVCLYVCMCVCMGRLSDEIVLVTSALPACAVRLH